ncbi:MAG: IgA Peptidase M64 [Bacteroidales bacterium]|nr:IgA Peptidase M64 [Bacteroidales bacterium]
MKILFSILSVLLIVAACKQVDKNKAGTAQSSKAEVQCIDKGNVAYSDYFAGNTLRLDFFHGGNMKEEKFSVDQVVSDGAWPGSKTQLIDKLELGLYFYKVVDKQSHVLLYSRGFASIFGEWQTTPEADSVWGTFSESIRFPWPLKPVIVILEKRDADNKFQPVWSTEIDPSSRQVTNAENPEKFNSTVIFENGPATEKLDLVILGDGYTAAEMAKFRKDATRLTDALFSAEPFKSRKADFNVRAVETPTMVSGVCKPHHNVYKRTPLSVHYSSFDSERYALSYDNRAIRDAAAAVPYDFTIILVNEQTYGGGGIYNLYTTVSADNKFADYIMIHELGHHMAALADEYYTSSVAYEVPEIKVEPWETNITALFDKDKLKWKDLLTPGTPLPTPWNKEEFDKFGYTIQKTRDSIRAAQLPESVMEDLFARQMAGEDAYFAKEKYREAVGAFEGAGYTAKGLYRSQLDCIMYTRHMVYCKVCQRSLGNVFDQYVK